MKILILLFSCLMLLTACAAQEPKKVVNFTMPETHHVINENNIVDDEYTPLSETLKKIEVPENKFVINKDYNLRDEILGLEIDWSNKQNDIAYFDNLDIRTLERLINDNFIDPNEAQNAAPFVKDIFIFMSKNPHVFASGYLIGPYRDDYRISIDGLNVPSKFVTEDIKNKFLEFCRDADEIDQENGLMSWWD
jgi:hypothetical protein